MQTGIVKWFSNEKGYGFINSQNKDYFVHFKDIKTEGFKTLEAGASVRFKAETSNRGDLARDVHLE